MKFDLLNQSIALNADESPSIFNTLCMIRSLFRDVKDAAGESSLSQCPIGDEKLPLEMIWLSKELLRIYEDNDESLRRNRVRLDSIMEKLAQARTELETIADAEQLLPKMEKEYQDLTHQLAAAKQAKARYDSILARIESLRTELTQLRQFDAADAARTLEALEAQAQPLRKEKAQLETALTNTRWELAELDRKQRELVLEIGRGKNQYERDSKEYEKHSARKQKLLLDLEELTRQNSRAADDLARLQVEYDKLHDEDLPAAGKLLGDETKRRDELQAKVAGIQADCRDMTQQIDRMKGELPELEETLRNTRNIYNALTATYSASNRDIVALQSKIRELESENHEDRLAQVRVQLTGELQKLEALRDTCGKLEEEIRSLGEQIQELARKQQDLQSLKDTQLKGQAGIDRELERLRPFDNPEFRDRVRLIQNRYQALSRVRDNLERSITQARRHFSGLELAGTELDVQQLGQCLSDADKYACAIYQDLAECAETLKKHMTEELQ